MRELSPPFMNKLKTEELAELLRYVVSDNTLDLEIREDYINIYYRGGNILKVVHKVEDNYEYFFDENYRKGEKIPGAESLIQDNTKCPELNVFFPQAKQMMDFYFTSHPKEEREFQQLVVRENNYSSVANGTDYFIIDIEYDNHNGARFDIVALEWPSNASNRKLNGGFKPALTVFEMKYGDGAIRGSAGIIKHEKDFSDFNNSKEADEFRKEMLAVFKQKRELGLIPCIGKGNNENEVTEFDKGIKLVYLIANHDPESRILKEELKGIEEINSQIITANFFGYGLYNVSLVSVKEFIGKLPV